MKRLVLKLIVISGCFLINSLNTIGQCAGFPATLAETDCGTGSTMTNNSNINSGTTFAHCATSSATTSYSNINLSGGRLNLCGNVTIQGSWNSGEIVVACGANVTFSSGLTMNSNVKIVNYGTVTITGNLNFQNNNNSFFNEATNSRLNVTGNIIFAQNNGQNGYLKNNGYISAGGNINILDGGFVCFGSEGKMDVASIQYGSNCGTTNNRVTYGGTTIGSAIIKYTGNADLRGIFTNSSNFSINRAGSATQSFTCGASSSWGSATVANNSPSFAINAPGSCATPNCFTTLGVELDKFEATETVDGSVVINWNTISERNNERFILEFSTDGKTWNIVSEQPGQGTTTDPATYMDNLKLAPGQLYYFRLRQIDFDGQEMVYPIISLRTKSSGAIIFPNPSNGEFKVQLASIKSVVVKTTSGTLVSDFIVTIGSSSTTIDGQNLPNGIYFLSMELADGTIQTLKFQVLK